MRVLVACEFSGIVRDAFRAKGHNAWSCDLTDCEAESTYHWKGDVLGLLDQDWDMMIAHPPCTYLSIAGYHYSLKDSKRMKQTFEGLEFFKKLYNSNIPKVCCENPVSMVSTLWRKPDQTINPYQFGEPERKTTCLWLKGLLLLKPTHDLKVEPSGFIIRKTGPEAGQKYNYYWRQGKKAIDRSRTFKCIANAMAEQWG